MTEPLVSDNLKFAVRDFVQALIRLHGALLASARERYEAEHKLELTRGELLQLLINDPYFAWLRDLSGMVIRVDDLIDRKSKATADDFETTLRDAHDMLWSETHAFAQRFAKEREGDALVLLEDKQVHAVWRQIAQSLRS